MAGVFSEELKPELQDVEREFHLEGEGPWRLFRVHSVKAKLHAGKRAVAFDNPHAAQPVEVIVQNIGEQSIKGLALVLGKKRVPLCRRSLKSGEKLKVRASGEAVLYDANWGVLQRWAEAVDLPVEAGKQAARFDWAERRAGQALAVELRTLGGAVVLDR